MDYSFRNSTGSTVSEVFNAVLNSPLPIEFIYISHPFGTSSLSPSSDKANILNGNNNKWANSNKTSYNIDFNFDYMKYIQNIQNISKNSFKKNTSTENLCNFNNIFSEHGQCINKNNNLNNSKDIYDGFPKLILNTIRKAWISPDHKTDPTKILSKASNNTTCRTNMQYNNNDKRIKTFSTFNASSQEKKFIRRYSVPEIEIRKYEINQNTDLNAFYKNFHKLEKPQKVHQLNNKNLKKDSSIIKLNISESSATVKPSVTEQNKTELKMLKKQETTESDLFVSELLIKNHNTDSAISDLLIDNLNSFLSHKNSSLYITPEDMEEISSRGKTYEQTIEIPENIYIEPFESEETNYTNRTTSNDNSSTTISSADSLESSSNNNNKISLGIQVFPESFENSNEFDHKSEGNEFAANPTVFQKRKIISTPLNKSTKKIVRKTSASKSSKKTVINSLQAYKFDSRGNLQFSSASSVTAFLPNASIKQSSSSAKNVITKKFTSSKSSSTTASKSSFRNNRKFKKITMFEGQNQSTPDIEMGPKRFYQKTEIFDGDNKIDILEIIECLQASPPQRTDLLNSIQSVQPYSKIPIRVNRFNINLNKKLKPNSGKRKNSIIKVRPKLSSGGRELKQIIPIQIAKNEHLNEFSSNLKAFPKLNEVNNFDIKKSIVKIESSKNNKNENVKLQPIKDPLNTSTSVARSIKIDNESIRAPTTPTSFEQTISIPSSCTAIRGSSSNSLPSTVLPKVTSPCDRLLSSVSNKDSLIFQSSDNKNYHNAWRIPSPDYCDTTTTYKKIETMQISLPLSSCKSSSSFCCKCESPVIDLNHASPTSVSVCSVCSRKITPRCFIDNFFDNRLFSHHGFQNDCRLISCSKTNLTNRNYNMCTDCNNSCIYSNISSKSSCKHELFQLPEKNQFYDSSSAKVLENNATLKKKETINDWKAQHSKIKPITNLNKNINKVVTSSTSSETKTDKLKVNSSIINKNQKEDENPVWHITVSGPPDFKMELSFSKDSKNVDIEQTINGVSQKIEPNLTPSPEDEENEDTINSFKEQHCIYKKFDECNCSVNLINLPSSYNSPIADLSVLGNTICPEKKPKPPTMSERDLTRRRNNHSRLNI